MVEIVTKTDLNDAIERLKLSLTVRLGLMFVAGIGLLAALIKLG
jgi:hypothetical protein